jgi:hypothetical protein
MLERETETIIQILSERTIGSARSLALKDALAADLPPGIARYLQCEVGRGLQDDLATAPHFSQFKFSQPLIHRLTGEYTRALALEYIFTREEFIGLLENAVHFVENYLCRPQWTLDQFLFENSSRISLAECQTRFAYIADYAYFGSLIEGYLQQKGMRDIGREECRTLLQKIDDSVVHRHNANELSWLTRPIFEFLLLQKDIVHKPIPIKPLIVFFEDKKMTVTADYIERICHIRGSQELTLEQLALLLVDLKGGNSEPVFPLKQSPQPEQETSPSADESLNLPDHGVIPEETPHIPPPPVSDKRNIALSLTFSGMTESPAIKQSPAGSLRQRLSDDQHLRFLSTIFQHDDQNFRAVLDTLGSMTSWDDASLYLQAYFQTRGVDPLHPDAIEFTHLLQQWYIPSGHHEIH